MIHSLFQLDGFAVSLIVAAIALAMVTRSAKNAPEAVAIPVKVRENQ